VIRNCKNFSINARSENGMGVRGHGQRGLRYQDKAPRFEEIGFMV
jgi:hypothetical protein